jgi:Na+-driven multidrug efflux pump
VAAFAATPIHAYAISAVTGVLRSGGDTLTAAKMDLSSLWLFSLPATLLAAYVFRLPFLACYIVMFLAEDYIKILLCARYYKTGKWIKSQY